MVYKEDTFNWLVVQVPTLIGGVFATLGSQALNWWETLMNLQFVRYLRTLSYITSAFEGDCLRIVSFVRVFWIPESFLRAGSISVSINNDVSFVRCEADPSNFANNRLQFTCVKILVATSSTSMDLLDTYCMTRPR